MRGVTVYTNIRFGTYLSFNVTVRYDFGIAGGKTTTFLNKPWFTEQVALSLNKLRHS